MKTPRLCAVTLALVTAAAVLPAATPAGASIPRPAAPTGVHQVGATSSSFTVASRPAANALKYVLIASRVKSDIFFQNLDKPSSHRLEASSSQPIVTLRGLKYTTRPYYYRVQTRNRHRSNLSDIFFGYVAPAAPSNARLVNPVVNGTGLALTWGSEQSNGFTVEQATDPRMSQDRQTYRVQGDISQFTPYGLSNGTTYYFRVRADNGLAHSKFSPVVSRAFAGTQTQLHIMTWNVLHMQFDGTKENGNTIAPWNTKRLPVVVSMIKKADPDMIVINEANDWDGAPPHRQIDTLAKRLRGSYALADADFTINRYHPRTGNYILYRVHMFRPLYQTNGKAHYWTVFHNNNDNMVMYQAFEDVQTGAKFLAVAVHLVHGPNSAKSDAQRRTETQHLIDDVQNLQARDSRYANMPVIFGGDFNSFAGHNPRNFDSPGDLLRRVHMTDSLMAAQTRTNTKYGSVNGYTPKPSHTGRIIDHFYGSAGVAFRTWTQVMNLVHGRWAGTIPSDHNPVMAGISIQS